MYRRVLKNGRKIKNIDSKFFNFINQINNNQRKINIKIKNGGKNVVKHL